MKVKKESNGFITAVGSGLTDYDHIYDGDADIEPADPSQVEEAWHWNDGNPEIRETGNNIPPEPNEAKQKILATAENDWGWSRSQIRTLRQDASLFFDFVQAGNYTEAKSEVDYHVNNSDITSSEGDDLKDILDGKK